MSFYFINIETIGKYKSVKKMYIWKNLQVQLMSFYYRNLETIGKCKNVKKFNSEKNVQVQQKSLFLLATVGAVGKLKKGDK